MSRWGCGRGFPALLSSERDTGVVCLQSITSGKLIGAMASVLPLWKACGPVALPLLLLSVAVFTVGFDRVAFWWRWWRRGRRPWRTLCGALAAAPSVEVRAQLLVDGEEQMAWGEPLLQAAAVLAPLLGLIGTTAGLMAVLRQLGPQLLLPPAAPLAGYGEVLLPTLLGLQLTLVAMALQLLNQGLRRWQLRCCARTQPSSHQPPGHQL